jgi:hypothetical protein
MGSKQVGQSGDWLDNSDQPRLSNNMVWAAGTDEEFGLRNSDQPRMSHNKVWAAFKSADLHSGLKNLGWLR